MEKRLYRGRVTIEVDMVVLASDEREAERLMEMNYDEESIEPEVDVFGPVESFRDVPTDWRDGIPYSDRNANPGDLTCRQILEGANVEEHVIEKGQQNFLEEGHGGQAATDRS